jgi:hypothetical protein
MGTINLGLPTSHTHNTQPDYLPQAHRDTEIDKGRDRGGKEGKKGCKRKSSSAKT